MWWAELEALPAAIAAAATRGGGWSAVDPSAELHPDALLDDSQGPILIGARTKVCRGAVIRGPASIGADCLIGDQAMVRGPVSLGDGVRLGFATELKNAIVGAGSAIGPMCFVADSKLGSEAYLGAMVRTSNHRLDRATVKVMVDGSPVDSGRDKLGCLIGERASLGIQVIILPGRIVAPGSLFGPRITIEKNLPAGRYRLAQHLEAF
jgi:UDP-N-acetylglucosamine diphosphorylase / glucose-1-phosphate thymidylyltransferase / UDP-N-acetylgalactosamine diphosphorylase / glucosamine-1-phosphate N-acetyltransferase / galactosamine-1-phosphate N-acetyltransferase